MDDPSVWTKPEADSEAIQKLRTTLLDNTQPISKRIRTIFTLRYINNIEAIDALKDALSDPSALLAHEVAYCLGQMQNTYAIPFLIETLKNDKLDSMVRHEAGESLGAIGDPSVVDVLESFKDHPIPEIAETCQVALDLIKWKQEHPYEPNPIFLSVDPAPPTEETETVDDLRSILCDKKKSIFKRYRALFALRNINTVEAALAICDAFDDDSALFKHELAYVLGQMQNPAAIPALSKVLEDRTQHDMVRHEAAEALGAIATDETLPLLEKYKNDEVIAIKDSCEVALDFHTYYNSDQLQYADALVNQN